MRSPTLKVGDVFGSLTVAEDTGMRGRKRFWRCTCACGGEVVKTAEDLRRTSNARCPHCRARRPFKAMQKRQAPATSSEARPHACRALTDVVGCLLVLDVVAWQRENLPPGGIHRLGRVDEPPEPSSFKTFPGWWMHRHAGGECRETVNRYWHPEGGGCVARSRRVQRSMAGHNRF